jgi:uncharacterized membrane protein
MTKGRLEAFTDGVVAIIITIMVLELKTPQGHEWKDIVAMAPLLGAYVLSYVNVGLYWNNHHHMLQAARRINGVALWANLTLLFWLSLVPFVIRWMDESHFAALPVAAYGVVLAGSGLGYFWLQAVLIGLEGADGPLRHAIGRDWKGKTSLAGYCVAVPLAFVSPGLAMAIYVAIAVMWLIPDQRLERAMRASGLED